MNNFNFPLSLICFTVFILWGVLELLELNTYVNNNHSFSYFSNKYTLCFSNLFEMIPLEADNTVLHISFILNDLKANFFPCNTEVLVVWILK